MFILSPCCQNPVPRWKSQSILSPWDALQHCAISGPAVGAAQILVWSYLCVFMPPMHTAVRTGAFSFVRSLDGLLCTPHTQRLLSSSCAAHAAGREAWGLLPWPHCPGFNCGFISLCTWVIHWGLLLRLPWRTWVCPCEGWVWRWCSCSGRRGSGSTRLSGGLAAGAAGNRVLQKGVTTRTDHNTPVSLPGEALL